VLPSVSLQAVILAGGLGTRLRPVVGETPKVMAPVAGRPFLEHLLASLDAHGFARVILAVGFKKEVIASHFGPSFRRLALHYSEEQKPLGTGGAVRQALRLAEAGPCFVLNGDTWLDVDHGAMLRAHVAGGARLSIAVRVEPEVARFGALEIEGGRITRFREKGPSGPGFINAGVCLLARELLAGFELPEAFSLERDFFVPRVAVLAPLAFVAQGRFIDIGIPADYEQAQRLFEPGAPG
jgi:D-glycero-alpha-D-manno-heptose 1-phosphate guanylyltransferase